VWHVQVPALTVGGPTPDAGKMAAVKVNTAPKTANIAPPVAKEYQIITNVAITFTKQYFRIHQRNNYRAYL